MADYISRDLALSFPFANGEYDREHADKHFIYGCETYKEWLGGLPAADVAEIRHAHWIRSAFDGEYYCSYCGKMTTDRHDETRYFRGKKVIALCTPRYCGNCGARMDESEVSDNG